jgi:L-asparagine transporter-like permease
VNFQRSEIVGLTASKTENSEINVSSAWNSVAYRIILIYIIPMIFPYLDASLNDSVFNFPIAKHR